MTDQAVILAGGLGTRLSTFTGGLPKALVDVDGKPLIHRQLDLLARHHFTEVLLLVRHGAQAIMSACGDGAAFGLQIDYVVEPGIVGTAGAVLLARRRLKSSFAVLYGDTVLNVDLGRMKSAHRGAGADATLFVHPNDHPQDSDLVETDETGRIIAFHPKPHPSDADRANLVNAALYIIETQCLPDIVPTPGVFDFGAHLFPRLVKEGAHLQAYRSREYIKDAGTPERLETVVADVKSGRVASGSLETPAAAIFLDRDGTLNEDPGHIADPGLLRLFPGAARAIRRLNRSRYLAVVITNQPVVARGQVDEAGLRRIHNRLECLLGESKAYLDGLYYCPHHPDRGFVGERKELKIICSCRKPEIGLVQKAAVEMNIDLANSWMIGDTFVDVELARRARLISALVGTGDGGRRGRFAQRPDFEFGNIAEAIDFILDAWPDLSQRASTVASNLYPGDLVLIGGLARSGKSTFASALKWELERRNNSARILSLDGWIKPLDARPRSGTVLDRFDLGAIQQMLTSTLSSSSATIRVPIYNRTLRRPDKVYTLAIESSDIVIAEGVVALEPSLGTTRRIVRIFITRNEDRRRECLAADYRARQLSDEEFARVYARRQHDETPIIFAMRKHADFVFETP